MAFLEIKNLSVSIKDKPILKDFSLTVGEGEVHALMGVNGSGKSTLSNVLCGHKAYTVTGGSVTFKGRDLFAMEPEERAREGMFLVFQYPVEIPGLSIATFLKHSLNAKRKHLGLPELDAVGFLKTVKLRSKALGVTDEMLKRPVNVGFSGGEKKRIEMLQMAVLEPSFAILDELDSGLDVDAMRTVSDAVNILREPKRSFLVITHYNRLLEYIVPDAVHIMVDGRIVKSGDKSLALRLDEEGYRSFV